MRLLAGALLVLFLLAPALRAQDATPDLERVRILFIGNSYTFFHDLPRTLQAMGLASRPAVAVDVSSALVGGATLERHWADEGLRERIRNGGWDYVVLQEQSLRPIEAPDAMLRYARHFAEAIRAAGAKPVLFMSWARQSRPASQDSLDRSFYRVAGEIDAIAVPVGAAWKEFQRMESSHGLYAPDGSHPSPLGSFIAATAFYRALLGDLPPASFRFGFETTFGAGTGAVERTGVVPIPAAVVASLQRAVERSLGSP